MVYNYGVFLGAGSIMDGGLLAMFAETVAFMIIFWIAVYIYMSLAYKKIAEKAKYPNPNYAWIPVVGPGLITAKLAKMPNWPLYLLLGYLVMMIPFLGFIGWLAVMAFLVYFIIWSWKMFEGFGWPGALALLWLVPLVGFVLIGVLAWGDNKYNPKLVK